MLTELEITVLKGNATELRRIAKIMGALQTATDCDTNKRIDIRDSIEDLQERLNYVISNMESLKVIISNDTLNAFK
jgi:hypothetical protein